MRHIPIIPCFRVLSTFDLSPIQGASIGDRFPGLKPWAESSSPFGADPLDRLTGAKQIPGFQPVSGLATSKTLEIMGSVARLASRDGKGMNARKSSWRAVHPDHPKNPRTRTTTRTMTRTRTRTRTMTGTGTGTV